MAIDRNAEEHERLMEGSRKAAEATIAQNMRHMQESESSKGGGGEKSGEKSGKSGGKSGGGEKSGGNSIDDAVRNGAASWTGFKAIPDGGGASRVSFGDAHKLLMNELTSRGVRPEVAAGAVGSLMGESGKGLNPRAYNPNDNGGPSGGIAQWHNERLLDLYKFAGANDINKIPLETQVKFLGHELDGKYNNVLEGLKTGRTVADGVNIWTRSYEKPAHPDEQVALRMKHAEGLWNAYSKNDFESPYQSALADRYAGKHNGESQECVALVKQATDVGHTSNWAPGSQIGEHTAPGTPIATFGKDGRYANIPGQSHAALYLGPGQTPGSIKVLDQWNGHAAGVREIQPGNKPESAQNFRVIADHKGNDFTAAKIPGYDNAGQRNEKSAIPTLAEIRMKDSELPAGARSYYNLADDKMANKGNVQPQQWQDPGAAERARNGQNPIVNAPLPPTRPASTANTEGWANPGATQAAQNQTAIPASGNPQPPAQPAPTAPLPPQRPAPDQLQPAATGPQQHANMGPPDPQPMVNAPQPPTRPADLNTQAVPTPEARPPQGEIDKLAKGQTPGIEQINKDAFDPFSAIGSLFDDIANGVSGIFGGPQTGREAAPSAAIPAGQAGSKAQQSYDAGLFDGFGEAMSSLFNDDNHAQNAAAELQPPPEAPQPEAPAPEPDMGGGMGDIGGGIGSFIQSLAKGGPVGRPDRVAKSQPGVAIPTSDRGTHPGGGYSARQAITPGYRLGGSVRPGEETEATETPAPETPAPEPEAPARSSLYQGDAEPVIPVGGKEDKANQAAAKAALAEQRYAASHAPKNLGQLIQQTLFSTLSGVEQDYNLNSLQGHQKPAVPTQETDPITGLLNDMFGGDNPEAATPATMKRIQEAVDPHEELNAGARGIAGMLAGVRHAYAIGDADSANKLARGILFNLQDLSLRHGQEAYKMIREGDVKGAVKQLQQSANAAPDGTTVKMKANKDGGADYVQKTIDGKTISSGTLSPEELLGHITGAANGTAYYDLLTRAASGKNIVEDRPSEAYQKYMNTAIPSAPTETNDPALKKAYEVAGQYPQLPADLARMSKDEQKEVLAAHGARTKEWHERAGAAYRSQGYEHQDQMQKDRFAHSDQAAATRADRSLQNQKDMTDYKENVRNNRPMKASDLKTIETGVNTAFDEVTTNLSTTLSEDEINKSKSAAVQLRAANPSLSSRDAVLGGMQFADNGLKIEDGENGEKVATLRSGAQVVIPPQLVKLYQTPAAQPPQPTSNRGSWR